MAACRCPRDDNVNLVTGPPRSQGLFQPIPARSPMQFQSGRIIAQGRSVMPLTYHGLTFDFSGI